MDRGWPTPKHPQNQLALAKPLKKRSMTPLPHVDRALAPEAAGAAKDIGPITEAKIRKNSKMFGAPSRH